MTLSGEERGAPIISGSGNIVTGDISGHGISIVTGQDVSVYQVQVFAPVPATEDEAALRARYTVAERTPYVLGPFTTADRALFAGRDRETRALTRLVQGQAITTLYGAAGVGKSSLLAAGVIPRLVADGALVVQLQDYARPVATLAAGLRAQAQQQGLVPADDASLERLVERLVADGKRRLVIVLDQVERLFDSRHSPANDRELGTALGGLLRRWPAAQLGLLLSVRQEQLADLARLEPWLPGLLDQSLPLLSLDRSQAQAAISLPVTRLGHPITYARDLIAEILVPDLDDLTPQDETVGPAELQIVCHWLFQAAQAQSPPLVDQTLYEQESSRKGAAGIVAAHLRRTLETAFPAAVGPATRLLVALARPGGAAWTPVERLNVPDMSPDQPEALLEAMVERRLVIWRQAGSGREYSLYGHSLAAAVRQLAGPAAETAGELDRIWQAWLGRDALPGREQLLYLAPALAALEADPAQRILLLKGAVHRGMPLTMWSDLLDDNTLAVVRELEVPPPDRAAGAGRAARLRTQIGLLLGLGDGADAEGPPPSPDFGPLAWSAARHPDPATRRTAALALWRAYRSAGLHRLDQAWRRSGSGRSPGGERRGALADAEADVAVANRRLPLRDRLDIWWWRFRRRLVQERVDWGWSLFGGGLGAALGLGLWRGAVGLALIGLSRANIEFGVNAYFGFVLGASLVIGWRLARTLLLRPADSEPDRPDPPPWWLRVGLSGLTFSLGHLLVMVLNGGSPRAAPLVPLLGGLAGLALALALLDEPAARRRPLALAGRLAGLLGAGVLIQALFIWAGTSAVGLAVIRSGGFFAGNSRLRSLWGPPPAGAWGWPDLAALLDSGVTLLVLGLGLTLGLRWGSRWAEGWRRLAVEAGPVPADPRPGDTVAP